MKKLYYVYCIMYFTANTPDEDAFYCTYITIKIKIKNLKFYQNANTNKSLVQSTYMNTKLTIKALYIYNIKAKQKYKP